METEKRCSKCKDFKKLSEFRIDKTKKDGHRGHCKSCERTYHSNYKKTAKGKVANKRYQQSAKGKAAKKHHNQSEKGKDTLIRYPNHLKAQNAVNNAVKSGKLPNAKTRLCHYCPKPAQQYHHWHGYEPEYWLDVVPVCIECHQKYKRKTA